MNTPTEYCYIVSIFNSYTVHNTFVTIAFCQSNSINIFSIYLSIYVTVTDFGSAVSFGTLCISAPHILAFLTYDVFLQSSFLQRCSDPVLFTQCTGSKPPAFSVVTLQLCQQ